MTRIRVGVCAVAVSLLLLSACGGSGGGGSTQPPPVNPDFSLDLSSTSVILVPGGSSQTVQVSIAPTGGFDSSVTFTVSGIPPSENASPSSFSLAVGQSQPVTFSATSGATVASASVSVTGAYGALSHTTKVSIALEVAPPAVSSPSRTTFVRDDSLTTDILIDNTFHPPHFGVYDPVHRNFFVTNAALNRVEVYSAATEQLVANIPVPAPVAMDITVSGDRIYVGTFTDYLFEIDTSKLEVVQKFPSEAMLPGNSFSPLWPVALSDGRVLILTGFGVDGSAFNLIWNPATGTGQQLSQAGGFGPIFHVARSGDHSKVLVENAIYDVSTSSVSAPSSVVFSDYSFAGNQDGSRWYVELGNGGLGVLDSQLNLIAQSSTSPAPYNTDMLVSRDGQTVFVNAGGIQEYDATSLSYKGWATNFLLNDQPLFALDIDETGLIFGVQDHGVAFVDSATALHQNSQMLDEISFNLGYFAPDNAPLNVATPMQAVVLAGVNSDLSQPTVYFGAVPGSSVNLDPNKLMLNATSPSYPFPGPVNFIAFQPSGGMTLVADGFSFGPTIVYPTTNASVAQGGGPAEIFTFGAGTNASNIQIGTGSSATPASVEQGWTFIPYPFLNLQKLPFIVPAGVAGLHDLTVSAPSGSATNSKGFRYYSELKQYPLANAQLQQGVYDPTRKQIYFSNVNEIEVFSPVQSAWQSPIVLPAANAPRSLLGIGLSPDATVLAVSDEANGSIVVLSPDQPGSAKTFAVQSASDKAVDAEPTSLVSLTTSVYFVIGGFLRELNLGTGAVTTVGELGGPEPHNRVVRTGDGSYVAANFEGYMLVVNTASGAVTNPYSTNAADMADLAVSADGTHFVEDDAFLDSNPFVSGALAYSDAEVQDVSANFGQKFLSSGSLLLQPLVNQVDVIDSNTGRLRDRVSLPITIANALDSTVLDEPDNSLFLIMDGGIAQLPLDQLPMGLGSLSPAQAATGGGTTVKINGNGFVSGAQVAVDGVSVAVTFVDQHTLQVVAPAHSAGGAQVSVTNPNGEEVSVDDALNYSQTVPATATRASLSRTEGSKSSKHALKPIPLCRLTSTGQTPPSSCDAAARR